MATRTWTGTTSGDWSNTGNWLEGAVPATGDDVYFYNNAVSVTTGLDNSGMSGTITSLTIDKSYTGTIGTASAYLQVKCVTITIGRPPATGSGAGSTRIKIDNGGTGVTINVFDSASSSSDSSLPPIQLKGTSITSLNVYGGAVGLACVTPSEVSTVTTLRVTKGDGSITSNVYLGSGVTATTVYAAGGTVTDNSNNATTTLEVAGATYTRNGSGGITTLNVDSGTHFQIGTGTIATLNASSRVDFSKDARAKTVTACNLRKGATLDIDNGAPLSITFTAAPALAAGFGLGDVTIIPWTNCVQKVSFA